MIFGFLYIPIIQSVPNEYCDQSLSSSSFNSRHSIESSEYMCIEVYNSLFYNINEMKNQNGGALCINDHDARLEMKHVDFSNCSTLADGGALYFALKQPILEDICSYHCSASAGSFALFNAYDDLISLREIAVVGSKGNIGSIYVQQGIAQFTYINASFNRQEIFGSSIYNNADNDLNFTVQFGAITSNEGDNTFYRYSLPGDLISFVNFYNNTASKGHFYIYSPTSSSMIIEISSFLANTGNFLYDHPNETHVVFVSCEFDCGSSLFSDWATLQSCQFDVLSMKTKHIPLIACDAYIVPTNSTKTPKKVDNSLVIFLSIIIGVILVLAIVGVLRWNKDRNNVQTEETGDLHNPMLYT